MNRLRPYIVLISLGLIALIVGGCENEQPFRPSHVVVLVVDTLRRDRLGVHGSQDGLTSTLDRLAAEGFCFHNAVAPSSWTKPSVASVMTGLYPGKHGAVLSPLRDKLVGYEGLAVLSPDHVTLAERMQAAGYRTAAFVTNPHIIPAYYFDQGFDEFTQPAGKAEILLDSALSWLDSNTDDGRCFAYLHLIDPHTPYYPPEEYWKEFFVDPGPRAPYIRQGDPSEILLWLEQFETWDSEGPEDRFRFDYARIIPSIKRKYAELAADVSPLQVAAQIYLDFNGFEDPDLVRRRDCLVGLYDAEVLYTDDALSTFIQALSEKGILEDTLLIVTGDHGEGFLEHRTWGHGVTVFGEEVNVPLIFRVPAGGGQPIRGEAAAPASLVDLYPTILDITGLPIPDGLDGQSLWPCIRSGKSADRGPVFSEALLKDVDLVAAEIAGKKLIRSFRADGKVQWTYFDLKNDPGETRPLDPEQGEEAARALRKAVERLLENRVRRFEGAMEEQPLTEEEWEQMQALGYF